MDELIILAGGFGKRLRPLTDEMPKCMVNVSGKPMIEWQINWFKKQGIKRFIISCGYRCEKIKEYFGDSLIYCIEDEPLGTGGAIKKALEHVDNNNFFVLNTDDFQDVNLDKMRKIGSNCMVVSRFNCRFGIVDIDDNDRVLRFRQKPVLPYWANSGLYLLNKNIPLPDKGAIETETFPNIELKAYRHPGKWMTVNTIKDLEELDEAIKTGQFKL